MFSQRRPRIEWTHYISGMIGPVDLDKPASELRLDPLTVKCLIDAEVATLADVVQLVHDAEKEGVTLPKGIGKRRVNEMAAALEAFSKPTEPMSGIEQRDLILKACYVVARRCGAGALYHSGETVEHNGRQVLQMRWSAGSNWQALVRAVRHDDKHFHKCPLRRGTETGDVEVLEVLED